ncbi:MAG: PilZ domain-containing protein [Deltaproteobacteria bacterium]
MSSYDIDRGSCGIIKDYNADTSAVKEMKTGQKVRVKHFNISDYAITEIIEVYEGGFKIKITPKLLRCNVFDGDNITVILENNENEECLIDGVVDKAQAEFPAFFSIRCIKERRFNNCRKSRRYQIDACCNIIDEGVSSFGNVKNISFNGCRIMTKAKINNRKNFKMEIFIKGDKKALIEVGVVRVKEHMSYNEYGLVVLNMDEESKVIIREEIDDIIRLEKEFF